MKKKNFIYQYNNNFVKKVTKGSVYLEVVMTKAALSISEQNGTFVVPKIYSFSEEENYISFELIESAISLGDLLNISLRPFTKPSRYQLVLKLLYRVGKILAAIHNSGYHFNDIPKHPYPRNFFKSAAKEVYLHGDLTLKNLLYKPNSGEIVITDWSTPAFLDFQANWGPNLWDTSIMISSIFRYFPSNIFFSFSKRNAIALRFLMGYQSQIEEKNKIDEKELDDFLSRYNTYLVNKEIKNDFGTRHSIDMLMKFIYQLGNVGKKEGIFK